ncbi:MAG TPA: aspartate aminotransferase family protein [Candidatus Limnocylindrales bacterium]|nr:aspartate aminotransferase family protein [Candidatus Limnocylindrales bacterium]
MRNDRYADEVNYKWYPFTQMKDLDTRDPIVIVEGEGVYVKDDKGRTYIDGQGGLWNVNIGHRRVEVIQAIIEQLQKLEYFSHFGGFGNQPSTALARKLIEMTRPERMGKVFFTNGGSEAVETALKIARQYWRLQGKAGKYKIIARRKAYHGVSLGGLSANGVTAYRKMFEPLVPGFRHISPPYCYRCELKMTYPGCGVACADTLQQMIDFEGKDTVAAFIAEPVMGAGGVIIPPKEYLPRIQEICRKNEILFIADEVITGFGRTGEMFAVRHGPIQPDILVVAKGINSGYIPLGATLVSDEIYGTFLGELKEGKDLKHGFTYSGHPVACAAGVANLAILEKENLVENSRKMGAYLLEGLRSLEKHRIVGDVNGLGLLARVELVKDKTTREPFPFDHFVALRTAQKIMDHGVILRPLPGDIISFSPPLIIQREQIEQIVDAVDKGISDMEEEL